MKKKILSFVLGICLSIVSLLSFTGCSLVKTDDEVVNSEIVLKIGNTSLSKEDIYSAFSTYYQNNSSYFAYYGEDVIEDSFYQWAIVRQMLNDMSFAALYDAQSNPNGLIYYTEEDAEKVWENVESYIYSQVSNHEKNIYNLAGYDEKEYPAWIKAEEEKKEDSVFAPYEEKEFEIDTDRKNHVVKKLTDSQVKAKVAKLKEFIFEYVTETDEEGNETRSKIDETNYIKGARNQAYANYMAILVSAAKVEGTSTDANTCLEEEVLSIYNAYYSSQITSNFQSYFLNEYITNHESLNGKGDSEAFSDAKLAKAFLEEYYTQRQVNSSEAGYIETITNKDGAPLVLYSYNGQNYFFSVQHILVKFTENLDAQVKALEGYNSSSNDYDSVVSNLYKENRDKLASDYTLAMLTPINEKNNFDSIKIEGGYYFFDETKKDVYDAESEIYHGYIKLEKVETTEGEETVVTYKDKAGNTEYDADEVKFMATKDQILKAYNDNYDTWKGIVENYYKGTLTREDALKDHEDMEYIFDTIDNMKEDTAGNLDKILEKVASYLFIELQWVYSTDSLGNALSNKTGYVISNYPDENGSWVADFANGARELTAKLVDSEGNINFEDVIKSEGVSALTNTIVSDYGYHIIKVENVYKEDSSIGDLDVLIDGLVADGYDINFDTKTEKGQHFVSEIVKFMKKNYVCLGSNQTIYDYFFDQVYDQLVGTAESSGSYFVGIEYEWLSKYYKEGKIEYINKIPYSDLLNSVM
ncbi:MAG: hypothetical protein IJX17_07350 [Clostridia bacterium]|nr:hypothetical protein [Clostridia bacterium]